MLFVATIAIITCPACVADGKPELSDNQMDQLKSLATNTRYRIGRERDALKRARMELLKVYYAYNLNENGVNVGNKKVSDAQLSLLNVHLDNEIAMRNILTESQFQHFRLMMKRRMRNPQTHVLAPPEEAIFDRLPDKQMLDSIAISAEQRKRLNSTLHNTDAINSLRTSSKQLLDLYSNYNFDTAAARKLINGIHSKQIDLLRLQHKRQQQIRTILSEKQFKLLQQEIAKKLSEHRPQMRGWGRQGGR